MQLQSVLIHLPGDSQARVIVPGFEPSDQGAVADAINLLKAIHEVPPEKWRVRIFDSNEVTDLRTK